MIQSLQSFVIERDILKTLSKFQVNIKHSNVRKTFKWNLTKNFLNLTRAVYHWVKVFWFVINVVRNLATVKTNLFHVFRGKQFFSIFHNVDQHKFEKSVNDLKTPCRLINCIVLLILKSSWKLNLKLVMFIILSSLLTIIVKLTQTHLIIQ